MRRYENDSERYRYSLYEWFQTQSNKVKRYRPATEDDLKLKGCYRLYYPAIFQIEKAQKDLISCDSFSWGTVANDASKFIEDYSTQDKQTALSMIQAKMVWVNIKPLPTKAEEEKARNAAHAARAAAEAAKLQEVGK